MSTILLELDTRPPKVKLPAIRDIQPPAVWEAVFEVDEEPGPISFVLVDTVGDEHALGHTVEGLIIRVRVPTSALGRGQVILRGTVADQVCNVAQIEVPVFVMGEIGYLAVLDMGRAYDCSLSEDGYAVALDISRAYDCVMTRDVVED